MTLSVQEGELSLAKGMEDYLIGSFFRCLKLRTQFIDISVTLSNFFMNWLNTALELSRKSMKVMRLHHRICTWAFIFLSSASILEDIKIACLQLVIYQSMLVQMGSNWPSFRLTKSWRGSYMIFCSTPINSCLLSIIMLAGVAEWKIRSARPEAKFRPPPSQG